MFDLLTLAAVADELSATVLDGKIQKVGLADPRTLAFEIYAGGRRRALIASADDRAPRLLLTGSDVAIDATLVTPLVLLLRKYARGGIIAGIEQPPLERIVRISIAKRIQSSRDADEPLPSGDEPLDEDDDDAIYGVESATFVHLYVEIMGRHSNLILVDDAGSIMESVKRVTPAMSRVRPIQPRRLYQPPPPLDRPDPRRVTAADMEALLRRSDGRGELAGWLVRSFRGISPQMAREVAFQAVGDAGASLAGFDPGGAGELARALRQLLEPLATSRWAPRWYRDEDELPVAFAPVPMRHLADEYEEIAVDSISDAARQVIAGGEPSAGRHEARKRRLRDNIFTLRGRIATRLGALQAEQTRAGESERYREWGDLIYAYLWQIAPGQDRLEIDGVSIPLDPAKPAKENAQDYFDRYRRGRDAGRHLPERIEQTQAELAYLDQLALHVEQAIAFAEIESLQIEWEEFLAANHPGARERGRTRRSAPPRRIRPLIDAHGNAVYIGRSGAENDQITFSLAGPNDSWLHARGVAGSHVVVRWRVAGEEARETVEAAARLAAWYSAARNAGTVEVDIALRRHVRKIKGTGPGMVTYRNESTIAVRPASEAELAAVLSERA